jgi:hypothetical protein
LWKNRAKKERFIQLLSELSDLKRARVRERAAIVLGELRDAEAVPYLVKALEREKDIDVTGHIIEALGEIGDPTVISSIKRFSDNQERCELWTGEGYEPKTVNQVAQCAIEKILTRVNIQEPGDNIWVCPKCRKINLNDSNNCFYCGNEKKTPAEPKITEIGPELIESGSPNNWLEQIKATSKNNGKIKLPQPVHPEKEGYRNLLIALYSAEQNLNTTSIFADKSLNKIAGYIQKLKSGNEIIVDPSSSSMTDLDDIMRIMCGGLVPEKTTEGNVTKRAYKFFDAYRNEVNIEKKIVLNPVTRKADSVSFIRKSSSKNC